jgi:hypothetical protein
VLARAMSEIASGCPAKSAAVWGSLASARLCRCKLFNESGLGKERKIPACRTSDFEVGRVVHRRSGAICVFDLRSAARRAFMGAFFTSY